MAACAILCALGSQPPPPPPPPPPAPPAPPPPLSPPWIGAATPTGTALGCTSTVRIAGGGLLALQHQPIRCRFGNATTNATVVSDTALECPTPAPTAVATIPLLLDAPALSPSPLVVAVAFSFYNDTSTVASATPSLATRLSEGVIELWGSDFEEHGAPRCRIGGPGGEWAVGEWASVADKWVGGGGVGWIKVATCHRPPPPDAAFRAVPPAPTVQYAANGQCWGGGGGGGGATISSSIAT